MPFINNLYFRFRNFFSGRFPQLYALCNRLKSPLKFFIAGSLAGLTDLVFLYCFHGLLKWEIVFSTSLAFVLSFLVSFTLQKFWTFRNYSQKKALKQLALYLGNAFIGLNINGFLMHLSVNKLGVWYLLAQIAVNLLIGIYNFIIFKYIVFSPCQDENYNQQKTTRESAGDLA